MHRSSAAPYGSGPEAEGAVSSEVLLEELEQALIMSVKTAGLKKPRELAIVDQLLELRKARRQGSFNLSAQSAAERRRADELTRQLEEAAAVLAERDAAVGSRVQEEARRVEGECRAKYEEYSRRRDVSMKKFVSALKDKYNGQISALEAKLKEIGDEYNAKMSSNLVEKLTEQLEDLRGVNQEQLSCIRRYKETILVMSERERDMDDALARERARRHLAEEECGAYKKKLKETEDLLYDMRATAHRRRDEHTSITERLKGEHAAELAAARSAESVTARELAVARAELKETVEKHEAEMQLVDAKIRKALGGKDEVINELTMKLRMAERKVKNAETLIEELNAGISAI